MNFNKVLLAAAITLGMVSAAQANTGQFNFKGTVADTPCSIMPGALDKDFDFGILSQASLNGGGKSYPVSNTITLSNCSNATQDTATFAFAGTVGHTTSVFDATGVDNLGIELSLNNRAIAPNGTIDQQLHNGDNTLTFEAIAVGAADGTTDPVGLGVFNSVATFAITYS
ncbi:fimbrial protein [Serratia quinivorans]|uniref:fimbrial protein n=1 Tax=Serratia quinivorans TaxID=137545 RepID=UPI00217C73A5|nr:hypothetical protein [Serratia quinivorans]CAI0967748.1 Fimbria A protein precursor [Serratia quinivorans]CAI1713767.1 Fimbria A protein precursor [Serratia quinivorans]